VYVRLGFLLCSLHGFPKGSECHCAVLIDLEQVIRVLSILLLCDLTVFLQDYRILGRFLGSERVQLLEKHPNSLLAR
jgi:hypothetical protein